MKDASLPIILAIAVAFILGHMLARPQIKASIARAGAFCTEINEVKKCFVVTEVTNDPNN